MPHKLRNIFIKLRTLNHHLSVKSGRWYNIPLHQRICKLCNPGQIAEEFHYILECKKSLTLRHKYLDDIHCSAPNTMLSFELVSFTNVYILFLCLFNIYLLSIYSFIKCTSDFLTVCTCIYWLTSRIFHGLSE